MNNSFLQCIECGKTYPLSKDVLTCSLHNQYYGYTSIIYDYDNITQFPLNKYSWNKYLPLLPVNFLTVDFNEQKTPLIQLKNFGKKYGFINLYCKDESKNPTGSFKDKQCAVTINKAIEWKIKNIRIASSGNAAVSIAAYANRANISSTCFVTHDLSVGKRFLISLYGAKLEQIRGTYETVYRNTINIRNESWNVTPGINPIQDEGLKIIGFEIWEDIKVPDIIIVPCGNGTLLFGLYKAFVELLLLKKIDHIPQFIGVQVKNSSPLKVAFEQQKEWVALPTSPNSIAEGIIALESYSSPKVMKALKKTNGYIVEVEEP
jgi:threonine synthase